MSTTEPARPALGVGTIVGETFAIFFRRIGWFTLLAFLPLIVVYGAMFALTGAVVADSEPGGAGRWRLVLTTLLQTVGFTLASAFLVQAAYDTKLGRPVRVAAYLGSALGRLVPLVVTSFITSIGLSLAGMLLFLPGLWLFAVWSVVVPVIVVEQAGIDALGRSAALTKGYRWPIAGTFVLLGLCMIVGLIALRIVIGFVTAALVGSAMALASTVLGQALVTAAAFGLLYVGIALVYARMREIKEGTTVETLTDVFA